MSWLPKSGLLQGPRADKDFVIIARTDARGVTDFDDAVRRAKVYLDAGADAIFPEALETKEEFALFAQKVQAPLLANMTEFGKSALFDVKTLGDLGYRMVLFPLTAFRVAMQAARDTGTDLSDRNPASCCTEDAYSSGTL